MKHKLFMRTLAFLVSAIMIFTTLTGCAKEPRDVSVNSSSTSKVNPAVTTAQIAESISETLRAENEANKRPVR